MTKAHFERKLGGELVVDLCFSCQGIWFDEYESVQITPGSVITLFKQIQEAGEQARLPLREPLHCPRCQGKLLHGLDVSKYGGQFNYHRCLQKHGRFVTFSQFMIEKGFVRQLTPLERETLAAKIGTIHCNACGAPVDIRHEPACGHCRAPISILDPQAVENALARYHHEEIKQSTINIDALGDAIVMREREKSRRAREQVISPANNLDLVDLIGSGLDVVFGLIRH